MYEIKAATIEVTKQLIQAFEKTATPFFQQ
jgi:hypothetical protein